MVSSVANARTRLLAGTVGTYAFDANGDPKSATMAFWASKGTPSAWVFQSQFSVGQ